MVGEERSGDKARTEAAIGRSHSAGDASAGEMDRQVKERRASLDQHDARAHAGSHANRVQRTSVTSFLKQPLPTFQRSDFQVGGMVGQGSFATVHKAKQIATGRSVVLKVVRPESELDFGTGPNGSTPAVCYRDVLRAMKKEVNLMDSLGHNSHVVQVLGTAEDCRVLVMERAVSDLYTIIKQQNKRLPLGHAKLWAGHMIAAIDFIHSMGVVHQDIKSSNVIVFPDRTAKLCDFGLAKKGQDIMVVDRELITLWYRAPELLMGDDTYTPKVDEWGVGCVLLEMMIGVPPFKGKPECVCSCSQITHRNFNSDQLMKIFLCLGSPDTRSALSCSNHFGRWPVFPRKLESTILRVITADRLVHSSGAPATDLEVEQAYDSWASTIGNMLQLQPQKRFTAAQILQTCFFAGHDHAFTPSSPNSAAGNKHSPPTGEMLNVESPQSHSASGRDSLPNAQPHQRLSPQQGRYKTLHQRAGASNARRSSLDAHSTRAANSKGGQISAYSVAASGKNKSMDSHDLTSSSMGGKAESGYVPTDSLHPKEGSTNLFTSIGRRVDAFIRRGSLGAEDKAKIMPRRGSITEQKGPAIKFTADSKVKRQLASPVLATRRSSVNVTMPVRNGTDQPG
mmetsp:Transcript_48786/g.121832  ORF Transcript_48786/g.121832 Transcript_48786/m.121832 type:complete len:623 (-) Transcript_48786:174-2042(-)